MAVAFIAGQLDDGAEAFQLFDSWAGTLSRADYERFVLPHSRGVFARSGGQSSRRARHPLRHRLRPSARGDVRAPGPTVIVGLDWRTSIAEHASALGADIVVQGNLDPALVLAGAGDRARRARRGARRQRRPPRSHLQPRPRRAPDDRSRRAGGDRRAASTHRTRAAHDASASSLMAYGTPRTPRRDRAVLHRHPSRPPADARAARRPDPPLRRDRRASRRWPRSPRRRRDVLQARARRAPAPARTDVGLGLKHAAPKIEDGVAALAAAGVERVVGLVLAPHYSALSVGEYLDRGRRRRGARRAAVRPASRAGRPSRRSSSSSPAPSPTALDALPPGTQVVFTAHSLPERILDDRRPVPRRAARHGRRPSPSRSVSSDWAIAWQSAGRTPEPWLGPDVLAVIDDAGRRPRASTGAARVPVRLRRRPPRGALRPRHRGRRAAPTPPASRSPARRSMNADPAVLARARRPRHRARRDDPGPRRRRRHHRPGHGPRPARPAARRRHRAVGGERPPRRQDPHVTVRRPRRRRRGRRRVPRPRAARHRRSPATSGSATISRRRRAPRAAVWFGGLHPIPEGLLLGVPADMVRLLAQRPADVARQGAGRARAAAARGATPTTRSARSCAPASATRSTSGSSTRSSAASTPPTPTAPAWRWCRSSPTLAGRGRSLLLGARALRAAAPPATGPIFHAPRRRHGSARRRRRHRGVGPRGDDRTGPPVGRSRRDGAAWRVDDERFDAVVLATPAAPTAPLLAASHPSRPGCWRRWTTPASSSSRSPCRHWPERLHGRSGYLVPKPVQERVTAASFGSQKWAHWRGGGGEVLRVSLGRDGRSARRPRRRRRACATPSTRSVATPAPTSSPPRCGSSRWPGAFPQYRPHHRDWLAARRRRPPGRAVPDRRQLRRHRHPGLHRPGPAHRRRRRRPRSRRDGATMRPGRLCQTVRHAAARRRAAAGRSLASP